MQYNNPSASPQNTATTMGVDLPISDYAIIGDCRSAALISRNGSIDWLCFPHFSSPAVFSAILDQRIGGRFRIHSTDPHTTTTRRYIGNTNVLETTFEAQSGKFNISDCMPVLAGKDWDGLNPQRELLRIVECVSGECEIDVIYQPRPNFARTKPKLHSRGKLGWVCGYRNNLLILCTDAELNCVDNHTSLHATITLKAGEKLYFSLTYENQDIACIAPLGNQAEQRMAATLEWWENWAAQCTYIGAYRKAVVRSLLTLKLLTFQLSGAVIAAPTTSLPEHIGGVRNWDYRYCWLRDAALTFNAFADLGYIAEADAFIGWMLHSTRLTLPKLHVLYDIYGGTHLVEKELAHLQGYKGSKPVRIGNAAHAQLQLDMYGALVEAVFNYVNKGGKLGAGESHVLMRIGRYICKNWNCPDKGIWEIRGKPRHNTHSKLMCWIALDRLIQLADKNYLSIPKNKFKREREKIADAIHTKGYDTEAKTFTSAFGHSYLDASILLLSVYRFIDAKDPRMVRTYKRVLRELSNNGLIYRHRSGLDGLPPDEGTFIICTFWKIEHLVLSGKIDEAKQQFELVLQMSNDVGLLAEEADPHDGSALGNFPQAYSHVGLIHAATMLQQTENGSA